MEQRNGPACVDYVLLQVSDVQLRGKTAVHFFELAVKLILLDHVIDHDYVVVFLDLAEVVHILAVYA